MSRNGIAGEVLGQRAALVERAVDRTYARRPELAQRYGAAGREHCRRDTAFHVDYLVEAVASGAPALFGDYVAWAKAMLAARGIPEGDLALNLECLREALGEVLPPDLAEKLGGAVDAALRDLPGNPEGLDLGIGAHEPHGTLAREYLEALLRADQRAASALVLAAVDAGATVHDVYLHVFQRTQHEIGRLWQANRISVAQEHYCTAATQLVMAQLYPRIFSGDRKGKSLAIACVSGDLHEIGARMVADFFEMAGWDSHYFGASTPAAGVVQFAVEHRPDVVGISATLAPHIGAVADLVRALRAADSEGRTRILVGGRPFNIAPDLWREVGADADAADAASPIAQAESWREG
jgi:methylmalonyl-CoA mutase cobalamin-binding domain/chain